MKKVLLCVLSFVGATALAQDFTVDDTLAAGNSNLFYTGDSTVTAYDGTTGSGVTWDYSGLQGYSTAATNLDTIKYAANGNNPGDYPDADYFDDLNGGASNYFKNFADSTVSYGYEFTLDGNNVLIMHNSDPLKIMDYPMSLNDTYTDSIYGEAEVYGNTSVTAGAGVTTYDGYGTLLLGPETYTNVTRIKLVETIETMVLPQPPFIPDTIFGDVMRTSYTYYDLTNQVEPIFIHATISVASNLFNGSFTAVYSEVELPFIDASVKEELKDPVSVYPNPAEDFIQVNSVDLDELVIVNSVGQTVLTITNPQAIEKINVSELASGVYFVNVRKGNATKTEKFTVK